MRIENVITIEMNLIDTSTNPPHYFYWKRIRITNENLNFDIRVLRVNAFAPLDHKFGPFT